MNRPFSQSIPGQLELIWPASHTGWRLQTQMNGVEVGLSSNWTDVPGSTATNRVFLPIDNTKGTVCYRMIYP